MAFTGFVLTCIGGLVLRAGVAGFVRRPEAKFEDAAVPMPTLPGRLSGDLSEGIGWNSAEVWNAI
jgi:hypothetical protein